MNEPLPKKIGYSDRLDPFALYEIDVARVPKLSTEEERELLESIGKAKDVEKQTNESVSGEERDALIKEGEQSRERLISAHLWLVIFLAKDGDIRLHDIE